jgi:hypothetical protein
MDQDTAFRDRMKALTDAQTGTNCQQHHDSLAPAPRVLLPGMTPFVLHKGRVHAVGTSNAIAGSCDAHIHRLLVDEGYHIVSIATIASSLTHRALKTIKVGADVPACRDTPCIALTHNLEVGRKKRCTCIGSKKSTDDSQTLYGNKNVNSGLAGCRATSSTDNIGLYQYSSNMGTGTYILCGDLSTYENTDFVEVEVEQGTDVALNQFIVLDNWVLGNVDTTAFDQYGVLYDHIKKRCDNYADASNPSVFGGFYSPVTCPVS